MNQLTQNKPPDQFIGNIILQNYWQYEFRNSMAALSHCQDYSQPAKAYTYLLQYYLADSKQAFTDYSLLIIPEIVAFARDSTKKYS